MKCYITYWYCKIIHYFTYICNEDDIIYKNFEKKMLAIFLRIFGLCQNSWKFGLCQNSWKFGLCQNSWNFFFGLCQNSWNFFWTLSKFMKFFLDFVKFWIFFLILKLVSAKMNFHIKIKNFFLTLPNFDFVM